MENTAIKSNLNCKPLLIGFSLAALVCTVLGCYNYFSNSVDVLNFVFAITEVLPCALFAIFILKFNTLKNNLLFALTFAAIAFYNLIFSGWLFYGWLFYLYEELPFINLAVCAICTVVAIMIIKNTAGKVLTIVAISVSLLPLLYDIYDFIYYYGWYTEDYLICFKAYIFGTVFFLIAIVLFVTKNDVLSDSHISQKKIENMTPEQKLK